MHALHHGSHTLQAHTGIDARCSQRCHGAVGRTVVLHEHQVPDFDVTIAIFIRAAGRATGYIGTVIEEDLGTGTAGAGITHGPEVVFIQFREAVRIDAHFLFPDFLRFIVGVMNGYPQALFRQPQTLGKKFPGELDRFALEIIAEAEVAQHLEKGVMTCGVTDIFQVVVLAAGTHATLG